MIRVLTYAERRVLRLARLYQTVKRISAHIAPYAAGNEEALPQYTTGNTVAFAQDPEAITLCLCLNPEQLADDLFIQFEGAKEDALRKAPGIQVSVRRLRAALHFFLTRNWQWLEMTREHAILEHDDLGEHFEAMLKAYENSVGHADAGVPREVSARAGPLSEDLQEVHYDGPADATAGNDSESDCAASPNAPARTPKTTVCDSSSAVLDTGHQKKSFIWMLNQALDRYRILEKLEEQWNSAEDNTRRGDIQRQEAEALGEAVYALKKLKKASRAMESS